jgi:hypothetical protein
VKLLISLTSCVGTLQDQATREMAKEHQRRVAAPPLQQGGSAKEHQRKVAAPPLQQGGSAKEHQREVAACR